MLDLILQNATITDGTGKRRFKGAIGVQDGKIVQVGKVSTDQARQVLDCSGHVVAPGFIDLHCHSDLILLAEPGVPMKIRQGCTTELLGQDGISVAPIRDEHKPIWRRQLAGLEGNPDIAWDWNTVADYLKAFEHRGTATNPVFTTPHGALRAYVLGFAARRASAKEIARMGELLRQSLHQGAVGMSTGLIYTPCTYADRAELVGLCQVLAEEKAFICIHLRSEGTTTVEAVEEILSVGQETGCDVHLSHLKIAGRENWPKFEQFMQTIENYRQAGVQVTFDQYPYIAGSTILGAVLPPWVHDGGAEKTLERLADPKQRQQMRQEIWERTKDREWENFLWFSGPEGLYVGSVATEKNQWMVGKNFRSIAQERGVDPVDAIFDALLEERMGISIVSFSQSEEIIEEIVRLPYGGFCTDGIIGARPHPRLYGTFPRVLGEYVRKRRIISLEEAIRKMTSVAAQRLGFSDEGQIAVGKRATFVVFDPKTIKDTATFENPKQHPEGIDYVMVNGQVVVDHGNQTNALPGRVLRRER
ncbi:MAG: D-aminoacylase [Deinococcus sp.]|nr:D-aminoacylase [Deinococcus sp.]